MKRYRLMMAFRKRHHFFTFCLLLLVAALVTGFFRPGIHARSFDPVQQDHFASSGFAVVELFTSEGCSSCPSADRLLAKIDSVYKKNVYVLEFHVDYWDKGGWKDMFSNADYTRRQQEYSKLFYASEIYTPQAIINGRKQMIGSDETRLKAAIEQELNATMNSRINFSAKVKDGKKVKVSYSIIDPAGATLQFALVQLQAESDVLKGENQGRHLQHVNIVRDFHSVPLDTTATGGSIALQIPDGLTPKDCKVIVFLQFPEDGHINRVGEALIKE
jgi:hypothetical protein